MWVGSEWNRLITRQESAVDAVKLEWLMKGTLSAAEVGSIKKSEREYLLILNQTNQSNSFEFRTLLIWGRSMMMS